MTDKDCRKRISNRSEVATLAILEEIVPGKIFEKIRIADALEIRNSDLSDEEFTYALKAHFDFVVADVNTRALFVVEFDGPYHARPANVEKDILKDSICSKLGMPILRVSSEFLTPRTQHFTLLKWIVELWYVEKAFWEAQTKGQIPQEEDFTYWLTSTASIVDGKMAFHSYYLAELDDQFLRNCHKKGLSKDYYPTIYRLMGDPQKNVITLGCFRINDDAIIVGEVRFRAYNFFPISPRELSENLIIMDIAKKVREHLEGKYHPRTKKWVDQRVDELKKLGKHNGRGINHNGRDIYGTDNRWNDLPPEAKALI
jgi:very-short-patch-repair endonuclease